MDVLVAIGTDLALAHLHRFSRKARSAGFRELAEGRFAGAALARGLRPEQLADRIVPDLGLDADGRAVLDYGRRRFTVGFDERLQPWVAGANGRRLSRLPRPARADDPILAPAAYARFAEMRGEASAVAGERIPALEDAMVTGRRWTATEFRELFLGHPLTCHLTRRLLWATFGERDAVTALFRVAEDGTLANADDRSWDLPGTAVVGLPHPWHFRDQRDIWSGLFADYAIIQPFPQLGRELTGPGEVDVTSFAGAPVDGRKLFVLTSRDWRFSDHQAGLVREASPEVEIEYEPGYHWQEPDTLRHLTRVHGHTGLDPVTFSEVIRDLRYLTAAPSG